MSLIAAYFVHLHPSSSPRETAIQNMNSVTRNHFCLPPTLHTSSFPTHDSQVVPIITKFTRSYHKSFTPLQEWQHIMHLGLVYTSPTTMKHIIDKNILSDIPPSLHKLYNQHCTCHICSLSKSINKLRSKPVDKSSLAPFQCIHVDFSFFGETLI